MEVLNQYQIAERAGRVSKMMKATILSIPKQQVGLKERFFFGLLFRQELLLLDIKLLLESQPPVVHLNSNPFSYQTPKSLVG